MLATLCWLQRDLPGEDRRALTTLVVGALVLQAQLLRLLTPEFSPTRVMNVLDVTTMHLPAVLSLIWAVLGAALAYWSGRSGQRGAWTAGTDLMAVAAGKLVLLDFGSLGDLGNILALIAAGGVFMAVAWAVPMPPRADHACRHAAAIAHARSGGGPMPGARPLRRHPRLPSRRSHRWNSAPSICVRAATTRRRERRRRRRRRTVLSYLTRGPARAVWQSWPRAPGAHAPRPPRAARCGCAGPHRSASTAARAAVSTTTSMPARIANGPRPPTSKPSSASTRGAGMQAQGAAVAGERARSTACNRPARPWATAASTTRGPGSISKAMVLTRFSTRWGASACASAMLRTRRVRARWA
ncbi:MAG: DUF2339 domain-containing protein [Proteobacteria bacterium]|nr:DUF2339 domain-containing protein [Pseudomonadota bacterium]